MTEPFASFERHAASPFFRAEVSEMLRSAGQLTGVRAVDLGCGNGALVAAARSQGAFAYGLDADLRIVHLAETLAGMNPFLRGSVERLPFRTGSLEVVLAQHIIEHLHDSAAALREWKRVLRAGGRLVIITPNARYPDPRIYEDPTHVRIFDLAALTALLQEVGFEVRRAISFFPYLRGHTVFGLRHWRLFSRLPPWAQCGRSLLCVAENRVVDG